MTNNLQIGFTEKVEIAIFDLDGTLVDTDAANTAAYKVALRRYGVGDVFTSVLELSSH